MKITTTRKRNFFTFTLFIIISLFALISCEVDPVVSETSLPHKDRINNTFVFNQISFSNLSGDQDFKNAFDKFSSVRNKQTTALKHSNFRWK